MSTAAGENAEQIPMEIEEEENNINHQQKAINNPPPIDLMLSPLLLSSLSDLRNLGSSLSDFLHHWDDLQLTLNSILSSIDAQAKNPSTITTAKNNNSAIKNKNQNANQTPPSTAGKRKKSVKNLPSTSGNGKKPNKNQNQVLPSNNGENQNSNEKDNEAQPLSKNVNQTEGEKDKKESGDDAAKRKDRESELFSSSEAENRKGLEKQSLSNNAYQTEDAKDKKESGEDAAKGKDRGSDLFSLCEAENSKGLEQFVRVHISDIEWLRREVPVAIGRSKAPDKLILFAMNKFYKKPIVAFSRKEEPAVLSRRVSILLLELYLASGCCSLKVDPIVANSSKGMALAWRRRMIKEGGVNCAKAVDALGLVLFVACFGIPENFDSQEMYYLLQLSSMKKKANALQKSPIIREKIPAIVQDLLKKQMHLEAVNLICVFGLKEKFPPLPLLSSFLQEIIQAEGGQEKRDIQPKEQKEFNKKQLTKLRSVLNCLEKNKLDYHELANFNISQRINKLTSDIGMTEKKLKPNLKRKHGDLGAHNTRQGKKPLPSSNFSQKKLAKDAIMPQGSSMDPLVQNMTMSPGTGMNILPATGPPCGGGPTMRTNLGSMGNVRGFGNNAPMSTGATRVGPVIGNNLDPMGNIYKSGSHSLSASGARHVEGPYLGSNHGARPNIIGARSGSLSVVGAAHGTVTMGNNLEPWTNTNVGSGRPVLPETSAGHARFAQDHIVSSMRINHGGVGNSGSVSVGATHTGALTMGNNHGWIPNAGGSNLLVTGASHMGGQAMVNNLGSMGNITGISSSHAIGSTGPPYIGGMATGNNLSGSYGQSGHGVDAARYARGDLVPVPSAAWSDAHRLPGNFFQPPALFPTEKHDMYEFADTVLENESYRKLGNYR